MKNDLFNDRISRFSIRKLHVGVCSVLLGTLVMLGTATGVGADEVTEEKQADGVAATTEVGKAETPVATEATTAKETTTAKEVTYQAEAAPAVSTEVKPELKTETLAAYVAEVEANLANGKYSNKTDESVEVLKASLANAQNALATATSQAELDAAYQSLVTTVNAKLKNKEVAKVEKPVVETPATTEATTGKPAENTKPAEGTNSIANTGENDPRNGKEIDKNTAFRADTATATGIGADVEDATSTPKVEKPGFTTDIKAADLASQISWLDFGDKTNWTGTTTTSDGKLALQVGATYTKEIMPGYVVTIKVKSLKPFQATELYKKRLEERGATEAEKATYDPNAKNGYINSINDATTKAAFNNKEEAKVIADPQHNRWTEIRKEGIDTGTKQTTISSEFNGGNIGVQFEISATFRGKAVKPAIVMADGESANPGELVLFTTNGSGWQHVGEWFKNNNRNTKNYVPQDTNNLFDPTKPNNVVNIDGVNINGLNLNLLRRATGVGEEGKTVAWKYYGSADLKTGGLGTGVFGPNVSASTIAVPMVMTRGASEIGLYIASSGKQSAMLGFFPLDEGDAPESYGKAVHSIATVDGITGKKVNQPYLGHLSPDMDENNTLDWTGDDKATTADEGIDQLLPNDLKGKTNEMIKMDRTRPGNYTISVEAHTDGAAKANIYGWIDFNQNGTFDEDERSDLTTITQDGTATLRFTKSKTYIDPSVNELGVRVRIAKDAAQIESPTGMAFSGEVEDFKTQITHPPKGEFKETTGLQGAKQTATVAFTARGLQGYSLTEPAKIDETVAPYIVDANGNKATLDAEGYYVVPGQGKYKVTGNGKDVDVEFIPEDHFLGTADGISIRRTDSNGYDTGWSTKFPADEANVDTVLNTMDGLYIPTVTPTEIEGVDKTSTDVQGATQTGTPTFNTTTTNANGEKISVTPSLEYPAKLVDPATGQVTNATSVTVAGEGTYSINDATGEVTFVPEPGFTGTARGVTVSLTAPVGRDKDGTVRDEYLKTATAKYTPTVTPITVTPTNKVSEDVQNVPQTQTPTFDLSNDKTAKITSKKLVDPATGQPTDETTVTVAGEGSYTIDPTTGAVTFTPEKDFVGTAKGVTVQATATITNANGKTATITSDATYTPTVVPAVPTASPATSKDIQGATQTGTPTFAGTTAQVNGEDKAITIKDNSYTLLDKDGNEVSTTPAYAEDGTTPIGTFTVDKATGVVTFTPTDKSYTGKVTPVKVQAESSNGIKVDTTYTPEIVPVTPTATPAETTDIQGATQKGKPEFKGGTVTVDGVEKTVPINEAVPATFDDGSTTKTVEGVGTYTVAADGTVTFVPEKSFVGKAPAVTVVREDKNGTKASATYTPTVTPVTPTATPVETTDIQGATQTGKPVFTEGDSRVPMNDDIPATFDDGSTTKTVEGVGTYTVAADGTVTFVPEKSFVGKAPAVTVVREDKNGTKASATYTPTVTPVTPTATPVETTDIQGATQTGKPVFTEGDSRVPMNDDIPATFDDGSTTKTVEGVGKFTVAADGTVTFVPEKSFVGTAPAVTVVREDKNGTKASATYTPTVTPVTPTAEDATSTDKQGQTQSGKPTFTPGNSNVPMDDDTPATFEDGSTTKTIPGEGTYTVAPDGSVTFVPDKSFTGTGTGVTVKRVDKNGTPVTAKYTPTVTPVTPTATPAESVAPQGVVQTGTVTFTEGDPVAPIDKDTITLLDENGQPAASVDAKSPDGKVIGTFTVDKATGVVTFTPTDKSYSGDVVAVKVQAKDANGTPAETTYTPKITPVVPTAEDVTSTDKQGQTQTGKPKFTEGDPVVPMDDDTPATFEDGSTTKTIPGEGTYTVAPDGSVTFVPEKSFTGTGTGVTVKRVDKNGTPVTAKYTPTVTPVTPTAEDVTSTDKQGQTQTGKPKFTEGDPVVPMDDDTPATFEDGSTTKVIPGEGTYTVAPDGTVTFVPEKSFTGTGTGVTVKRVDKNGTPVTAKYTPTVTPVTPTATPAESVAPQGVVQTGTVTFTEGDPVAPIDKDTITLLDENGQPATSVVAKSPEGKEIGTFTVDKATGLVTFTPTDKSYSGDVADVKVQAKDANGTAVETTYTPKITPVVPTAEDATSTDKQGQTQTGKPKFTEGDPVVPMDDDTPATFEDGSTTKTIPGEGTYTVAPNGTVTFVPEKSFTGTGTGVTVKRVDKNGTPVTAKYTPTVTPVTPTATPAESVAPQGVVQTGTVTFTEGDPVAPIDKDTITLLDENGQPAASVDAKSPDGKVIGTFTVDKATGLVTFTPTDKSYSGDVVAVKVQAKDANGTPAETTYTPKITPVVPTAEPATSTDKQGQTQTGKPKFTEGDPVVPMDDDVPATFEDGSTTKTIPGEGTYTVAPDGTVTFVPEKSFTGTGTGVTVKRVDKNGTPVTAKYTPTVTPVTPTATPAESVAPQGVVQTGTVTFTEGDPVAPIDKDTITLLDENGQPATSVVAKSPEGKEIGTFTVDKETGIVTFTPTDKSYSGDVVAVKVQAKDANGTAVETTYTPKITPVVPTGEDVTSTDIQGKTQTGKPKFTEGNPSVPMDDDVPATFEDGSTTKTIPGEGTYTVAPDGTVTFVPEKSFTGTGTGVTVKRVDKNGTPVTAKYTPTVTPVTPTATPAESVAPQGVVQTGTVTFTEGDPVAPIDKDTITLLDENGKPAASVDAKSPDGKVIGTFTVDKETGLVTFTPTDKSYSGDVVPVKVQAKDANGTAVETTYTPKITPVVPTGENVTSTDIQGKTQTGKPKFTEGDPSVPMDDDVPATFEDGSTTKTIPGEGTYTVAPDGTVTFVPEKSFTGTGTGVTVKRVDKNGTPVTAKYTPTVTPITPTAEPVTSTDIQGQTQTGKPKFTEGDPVVPMDDDTPATFEDGSTTKTIPGEGTYTVAPDGTVTFVPEKSFTGTGTGVTVKRVDKNGTPVTAKYIPTVTPVTPTGEPATTIGPKGKEQSGKPTFKEGDSRVPMNDDVPATFDDGSTTKTIPGVGTYTVAPDGTVTFKPEPEFTGTAPSVTVVREDMNGTKASATYTPTVTPVTTFVDKDGNPIPGYPTVDGEQPKAEIPGYRFVETKKLPNGDTVHVYEKITTTHVDENGNPIPGYPTEDGEQPKKDIPGYEFVKTVVDANGNIQHIYKKVVTPEQPEAPVKPAPAKENTPQLPNTGTKGNASLAALGLVGVLSGFGLIARKKKED